MSAPLGVIFDKPILGFTLLNSGIKVSLIQRYDFGLGRRGEKPEDGKDCDEKRAWHDGLIDD